MAIYITCRCGHTQLFIYSEGEENLCRCQECDRVNTVKLSLSVE